jgi:UDP-4-amino-4,6-dideoxy-N-acetyl-beta-L-altrosamine N-acetyltransferase
MTIEFKDITEIDLTIIEKIRTWRNKERVRKFMLNRDIIGAKEHSDWVKSFAYDQDKIFWVIYIDKIPMGAIYLQNIDFANKASEWGYYIGEDNYVGRGYGKKILHQFLDMFFNEIGLQTLVTMVAIDNDIAIKIYKNFGFETAETKNGYIRMEYTKEQFKERS